MEVTRVADSVLAVLVAGAVGFVVGLILGLLLAALFGVRNHYHTVTHFDCMDDDDDDDDGDDDCQELLDDPDSWKRR